MLAAAGRRNSLHVPGDSGVPWEEGCGCLQDGAVAVLEVLLMKYLDSVSISFLSSV